MAARHRITSNTVIDAMIGRSRFITKTFTKRGPAYSFDDTMQIVPRDVAKRMIDKGILVSDDSLPGTPPRRPDVSPGADVIGQTYRLAVRWGGVDERA